MAQFIITHSSDELNAKISTVKKDIAIEMEIIKERIKDMESAGTNWDTLLLLKNTLSHLKEAKDTLKPF